VKQRRRPTARDVFAVVVVSSSWGLAGLGLLRLMHASEMAAAIVGAVAALVVIVAWWE
jgi:hypothetical protein